ncbi:MAG: hypothetical protein FWE44_06670 [Defluviitaleaceae bacterium]|nr:hypothetical protein [Defluviitaleaceae bacterium]
MDKRKVVFFVALGVALLAIVAVVLYSMTIIRCRPALGTDYCRQSNDYKYYLE